MATKLTRPVTPVESDRIIWVRTATTHTPAHRLLRPADPGTTRFRIACPPGNVHGGTTITADEARYLGVYLCTQCFPEAAAANKVRPEDFA